LIYAATVYLFLATFSTDSTAYLEVLTIYVGVLFATVVSAIADWVKEKQYLKIKDEVNNATVIVFRGQYGTSNSVPVRDIVVGDVIDV
jgi:Ca2+-transporting ATPase